MQPRFTAAADRHSSWSPSVNPAKLDWANLARYGADNASLPDADPSETRVMFMGDFITDGWGRSKRSGEFFPGKLYVNRGISGQTTPQMLVRFEQDVVHLHPAVVVKAAIARALAGRKPH